MSSISLLVTISPLLARLPVFWSQLATSQGTKSFTIGLLQPKHWVLWPSSSQVYWEWVYKFDNTKVGQGLPTYTNKQSNIAKIKARVWFTKDTDTLTLMSSIQIQLWRKRDEWINPPPDAFLNLFNSFIYFFMCSCFEHLTQSIRSG